MKNIFLETKNCYMKWYIYANFIVLALLSLVFVEFDLSGDNKLLKLRTLKICVLSFKWNLQYIKKCWL